MRSSDGRTRGTRKKKTDEPPLDSFLAGAANQSDAAAVEDLLRATEDDLLLKLRVDSHSTSRPAFPSSSLDPDLARRFDALKSPPATVSSSTSSSQAPKLVSQGAAAAGDDEWGRVIGDDLAVRFAALKGSSGASGSGSVPGIETSSDPTKVIDQLSKEEDDGEDDVDENGVSKKQVEKLLQWAMDAARLDLAGGSDEIDGDGDSSDAKSADDGSDDDEEDEEELKNSKLKKAAEKNKEKGKPKKWFLF